jgi:RNA polymerase sigma-70 factor (ECF subfamily)
VNDTVEAWFRREILPHEAALVRFLMRKWVDPSEVHDIRHDIYIRILETAERERPNAPRAFLFSVARHLLIDRARRQRIVAIDLLEDMDVLNVLIDEVSAERRASGREQLQRLSRLFDRMPLRCREVVWMRRVLDLPQKEIARQLGIAEATVEKHLVRGIRLLADALHGSPRRNGAIADEQPIENEPNHGE